MWRESDGVNISAKSVYLDYREQIVRVKDNENLYVGGHLWEEDEFYNPDDYMARPGGNWETNTSLFN
ncbi:hypothetical protein [Metabacillus sp. Hm71]|uniref:hypothetical protein n=1 Tax=Metabacillus sp. Hm71 TaxID=3450743 RepID=UPI003F433876